MKVVSLLPSATEVVYALGAEDFLCAVSCDCDYPEDAKTKPVVSSKILPIDSSTPAVRIDELVRDQLRSSDSIFSLDRALIQDLQPDLILAQDLCRVCAVPSGDVEEALDVIGCRAEVLSLDPHSLAEVIEGINSVGDAVGESERARALAENLQSRLGHVRRVTKELEPRRVLALEWPDPPFNGGHWVPEMVEMAGGSDVLGERGRPSRTLTWEEIEDAAPDVIVYMPCGFGLEEAVSQARDLYANDVFANTPAAVSGEVFATDASSYFSRPGPRLIEGVEMLAGLLHPELFPSPAPSKAQRVRALGSDV